MKGSGLEYIMSDIEFDAYHKKIAALSTIQGVDADKARKELKIKIIANNQYIDFYPFNQKVSEQNVDVLKGVAVLNFSGAMESNRSWWNVSTRDITESLRILGGMDSVTSCLFTIQTGGGSPIGISELSSTITNFQKDYGKKLVVLVKGYCESAGIWAVCGANELYIEDAICSMGSVGVQAIMYDDSERMKAEGVKIVNIRAKQSINKNIESDNAQNGDYQMIVDRLTKKATVFIEAVKNGRGDKLNLTVTNDKANADNIPDVLTGLSYVGMEAVEIGLCDGIKSEREILDGLIKEGQYTQNINLNNYNNLNTIQTMTKVDKMVEAFTRIFGGETAAVEATIIDPPIDEIETAATFETVDYAKIAKDAADAAVASMVTLLNAANEENARLKAESAATEKSLDVLMKLAQNASTALKGNPDVQAAATPSVNAETVAFVAYGAE